MEVVWVIVGIIFLIVGFIGCFLPVVPGPPLAYVSLLFLQLKDPAPFTSRFIWIWAFVVAGVFVLDYVLQPLATKKMGGSRNGVIGSTIGVIFGLIVLPPLGILIFPFLFAFIGEVMGGTNNQNAMKAALGSFIGFVSGVLLKLVVTIALGYYFVSSLF